MSKGKSVIGSDLAKVDVHVIQPEEYDEIPELTDELFDQADLCHGTTSFADDEQPEATIEQSSIVRS